MRYTLQVYKGKRKGWYLRIIARNGKVVMDGGEAYSSKSNAQRAAERFAAAFAADHVKIITL